MNPTDAVNLLAPALPNRPGVWADFGAGDGTFTAALARLLGAGSTIYAVDRDAAALRSLLASVHFDGVDVIPIVADFTRSVTLPGPLDGMVVANALHFVRDADVVLGRLVALLRPGGQVVVIEYDRRGANRWVPYPLESAQLARIAAGAGLSAPSIVATRPSRYGGDLYVAQLTYLGKGALSK